MFNAISAHIELFQGDDILGVVILYCVERVKISLYIIHLPDINGYYLRFITYKQYKL